MKKQTNPYNEDRKSEIAPFFSVIVTTYNRSHLIERTLTSLLSQTEKDWEGIIIDDGSTDGTYAKIRPLLQSHPKLKYRKILHGGEASAKNQGIQFSSGKFVTFLDSDDEYEPLHLKSRKLILKRHPLIQFLHGGVDIIGNPWVPDRFDPSKKVRLADCAIGGSFVIERSALLSLKGFKQIQLGTDADLFERAVENGLVVMKTNLPTYIYHHETPDSITNRFLTEIKNQKNA